jgi:hypothetical protein
VRAGHKLVAESQPADRIIRIRAHSRKGQELFSVFFTYLEAAVWVADGQSNEILYSNHIQNVKGAGLDYSSSEWNAYRDAARRMEKFIFPDLMKKL